MSPQTVHEVGPGRGNSPELFADASTRVSPSWLTLGHSRYAIRTIGRLQYQEQIAHTGTATAVFFFAVMLIVFCLYRFSAAELPTGMMWILLLLSVGLCLVAGRFAFFIKPHFRIHITLIDGERVLVDRSSRAEAQAILNAITQAMDWHRSDEVLLQVPRESHVRRRIAKAREAEARQAEAKAQAGRKARHLIPPLVSALIKRRQ